jgi:pSer/pThr/pTyr-binding forkhead associated (FHA) protein
MQFAVTNYAAIIRPLQLLVLAVAGIFLLRVLRVASVAAKATDGSQKQGRGLALEIIEPLDRAGERVEVEGSMVLGRAPDCQLRIADNFLSSHHARFQNDGGDLTIEDLDSTNGSYVNQVSVTERVHLDRGDIVQVGGILFEVVR